MGGICASAAAVRIAGEAARLVFQTKGDKVKFDFDKAFVDQVLAVMQEAPVPFKIVNPMLQEFIRQINDERIQSLEYPPVEKPEPEPTGP